MHIEDWWKGEVDIVADALQRCESRQKTDDTRAWEEARRLFRSCRVVGIDDAMKVFEKIQEAAHAASRRLDAGTAEDNWSTAWHQFFRRELDELALAARPHLGGYFYDVSRDDLAQVQESLAGRIALWSRGVKIVSVHGFQAAAQWLEGVSKTDSVRLDPAPYLLLVANTHLTRSRRLSDIADYVRYVGEFFARRGAPWRHDCCLAESVLDQHLLNQTGLSDRYLASELMLDLHLL